MDSTKLPEIVPALSISPTKVEIVFAENPSSPLAFVSPPIEDINEMADLQRGAFSLRDSVANSEVFRDAAIQRLSELSNKSDRFEDSATFHNRLANLFSAVGDSERERMASERAYELRELPFFGRKLGEARARRGDVHGAKSVFERLQEVDSYSALRLASFCVVDGDLEGARRRVLQAVELHPAGYAERLFQGALSLIEGDLPTAISCFKIALDDKPTSSVAYANLGLAYLGLQRPDKALQSLKRAVSLDPFNRNALIALADVGTSLGRDDDVINGLRYFVQFEQKDAAIWGRLARALLRLDLVDDCIHALKRQGSLEPSVAVWNNLGVAYAKGKRTSSSLKAFTHALSLESSGFRQDLLVARNITALISKSGQFKYIVDFTAPLVAQDVDDRIARDPQLADIYSTYIHALVRLGRTDDTIAVADRLLGIEGLSGVLSKWILIFLSALYGLERNDDDRLSRLLDRHVSMLGMSPKTDIRLINNVAFGLAELDRLDEASRWISLVSWAVHHDPYITATLGLISLKKGNLARGEALYKEAVSLAVQVTDKTRIRQKMHVELGRALMKSDKKRGLRLLTKAVDEKKGEKALRRQARQALNQLPTNEL